MNASAHLRRLPPLGRLPPARSAARRPSQIQRRWASASVTTLSDGDAVSKFRTLHAKSVLYFTATWCPPCKMISPAYDELSEKYADVAFGKVDVDENQGAAAEFGINAVPTFVFSEGEEVANRFSGADKGQLERLVKDHQES